MRKKVVVKRKRISKPRRSPRPKDRALKKKPPPDPLRAAAERLLNIVEEAISAGAIRLPYPNLIEFFADLKRSLRQQ
jgi:hypothetical protein